MSASVGTTRAGSNRHTGSKEKMTKNDRNSLSQQSKQEQHTGGKNDAQSNKMQPTQEQLRMAEMMNSNQSDANPDTVKELMEMTGKSEDNVVIALHDAENDPDRAVLMLLEAGNEQQQGEWREQGGKRKKKGNTSSAQKESSNNVEDNFDNRNRDRGDRDGEKDRDGGLDRHDAPPRRGRRNGGPPPRLARGRGRDRGNFGDRDRDRDRNNTDDWDNERGNSKGFRGDRDRSGGGDRGRPRGRGGFSRRGEGSGAGGGGGRGRFNNSNDRDSRSFNHVPRFEKMNNSQPMDGPEIDTWTNETAETNTSKDTDWDNWNDTWVNEEDQWTGTLEETKVFTPSQVKIEPDPVIADPPSSLGQRLDVGSLFIESAKFSKAPDYSKPSGDAYINQFNQAATESIKNTIGIGSGSRPPQSMSSLSMASPSAANSLGLSSLAQSSQGGMGALSSLNQQGAQGLPSLSQMSQAVSQSQAMSQIGMSSQHPTASRDQGPPQSRMPSVMQQQQQQNMPQTSMGNSLQQRPKQQRSKLPPPSKIPASAVEMPGHLARNPQLDLQFGVEFGSEPSATFGFGSSGDSVPVTSSFSTTSNGPTSSVISNHLGQTHVSKSNEGSSIVSTIMVSPSAGSSANVPTAMDNQAPSRPAVFHNSVYTSSPPMNETQSLEREQNMSGPEPMPFPSSQLERKSSPLMSTQRQGQTNQNLSAGPLPPSKNDASSNNIANSYSTSNGYPSSSYQNHQKVNSQSQSYTHTTNSQQPAQGSSFPGQYQASQSAYPASGQTQFPTPPSGAQFPPAGQPPQFNNSQSQYSSGQNQFSSTGSANHPNMPHPNHQSQYSANNQNSYSSGGQSQYSSYQNNSSFPSHPPSQSNFPPSNQAGGPSSSLYPVSTQSSGTSYNTSQSNSYQSPPAGSYHAREGQSSTVVSTQSSSVPFPNQPQSSSLKPATTQSSSSYSSQNFNTSPAPLQPSSLANKLGESLSKLTLKDSATLDGHQSSQYERTGTSTTTVSSSMSRPTTATTASLSTGTTTISSTSTATSITSTSRIASMPATSKAPPNLPPGVPLMGQYMIGQSTMPPFYSVQPPMYGYEDLQLLQQQRMPLQTGSYYDMSAFPAPAGSTLSTGRDQQPPIPSVPFSGTTADSSKIPRVDAQSPNASSQPQNSHSAAQQPLINVHYGYYYPSMFPGAAGLQYPMFPIPPVTNAPAHAGTTATTQFQKSQMYTTKGYDELNQAQDFSKTGYGSAPSAGKTMGTRTGTTEITPNAYNKSHTQGFDKQGFHGGTPPPYNLPLATATQAGPMGAPTAPYGAPFLPMMAAHQPHSPMMHHPIQQDSNTASSRGVNQTANPAKTGAAKTYGGPPYWAS